MSIKYKIINATMLCVILAIVVSAPVYAVDIQGGANVISEQKSGFFSWFFTKRLYAGLKGDQGWGSATLRLYPNQSKICADVTVRGIERPESTHLHHGSNTDIGPIILVLPSPDGSGSGSGCVSVDSENIQEIRSNAYDYYVDVHYSDVPDGLLRGQLTQ